MKQTLVAAATLAVGATAQNSTSTFTQYYNTCSTTASGIVTDLSTVTWCPPCEAAQMTTFAGGSLTTYTTTYKQVCPTDAARLEDATYTVTEPCPSTGLARGPSYIPQGFTVTTVSCSACEAGKSQYAQTTPVPKLASALVTPAAAPAAPTPAPAAAPAPGAGGSPAAPVSGGAASPANTENGAAAPGAPAAPGSGGAASPANTENGAAAPGAPAAPGSGGAASPANAENSAAAPGAPAAPGAASPANAENAAAPPGTPSPAENGAAAPAGAPAPYPLPSQAGQVAIASGAPLSNSTIPFTGAANIVSVGISSFIIVLATLITGFAFVL